MNSCPKCGSEREENFDVCWNCNYNYSTGRIESFSSEENKLIESSDLNVVAEAGRRLRSFGITLILQILIGAIATTTYSNGNRDLPIVFGSLCILLFFASFYYLFKAASFLINFKK